MILELLTHNDVQHRICGIRNTCTRTKDGGDTAVVQELVVLRGNHTAHGDDDVLATELLSSSMTCGTNVL